MQIFRPSADPDHPPLVITIQSQVVHGHVGNSAATLPMQVAGLEVAAIPTVLLSNTPHYPTVRGGVLDGTLVEALLTGILERGLGDRAALVMTGYLGSEANAVAVARFVQEVKRRRPGTLYLCDPVLGDREKGVYVAPGIERVMREDLLPCADLATPNQFELGHLAGLVPRDAATLDLALDALPLAPGATALVTGLRLDDTPPAVIETAARLSARLPDRLLRCAGPRLARDLGGCGDLFNGLLVARLLRGATLDGAIRFAMAETHAVMTRSIARGERDVMLADAAFIDRLRALRGPAA